MHRIDRVSLPQAEQPQVQSPLFGGGMQQDVRMQLIYPFTPIKMLGLFARTCQKAEAETAFLRLLQSTVGAEPESYNQKGETRRLAAIAILKRHPELLFRKGIVIDHFGRKIFASPYQLFLGAGDSWALIQVYEEIIPLIKDGDAQALEQYAQQFPNCQSPLDMSKGEEALYDDRNKMQIAQVIVQLEAIVETITADPCTNGFAELPETTKAVAGLCQLFAPKDGEVIQTGLHFPLAIMKEIFNKVFERSIDRLDLAPWTNAQRSFFSREVIGAALAASTAVDGQCYKHGLLNLEHKEGPDRQDGLFCRHPKGIPQKIACLSNELGRSMFVDPYKGYSGFLSLESDVFDCYDKNGAVRCLQSYEILGDALALWRYFLSGRWEAPQLIEPLMENKSRDLWGLLEELCSNLWCAEAQTNNKQKI